MKLINFVVTCLTIVSLFKCDMEMSYNHILHDKFLKLVMKNMFEVKNTQS